MNDARRLQRLCETQAALSSNAKVREALLEMAEEYRIQPTMTTKGNPHRRNSM